jgi:hypothetical protein
MKNYKRTLRRIVYGVSAVLLLLLMASLASPACADTCVGNCGTLGANGVVPLSPTGNSSYQFVSTNLGLNGVGALPTGALGSETNGSTFTTSLFSAAAGDPLNFYFNYTSSDGAGLRTTHGPACSIPRMVWWRCFSLRAQPLAVMPFPGLAYRCQ